MNSFHYDIPLFSFSSCRVEFLAILMVHAVQGTATLPEHERSPRGGWPVMSDMLRHAIGHRPTCSLGMGPGPVAKLHC